MSYVLFLPTYSPWLTRIEMFWLQFRRDLTHCELLANMPAGWPPRVTS